MPVYDEDIRRERDTLQVLLTASYRFSETITTGEAADVLAEVACALTGADGAHVFVPEELGLRVLSNANAACTTAQRGVLRLDLDADAPDVRESIERGEGFFVQDAGAAGQLRRPLRARFGIASMLFVPLADFGVLVLWWTTRLAACPGLDGDLGSFAVHAAQVLRRRIEAAVLRDQTLTDPLTGLANRRALMAAMQSLSAGSCVVLLDLDHFKRVNDQHGHRFGDLALQSFAGALQALVPGDGCAARYGGEEFALVLPSGCEADARHLVAELQQSWRKEGLTFSAGLAVHRRGASPEESLEAADRALYVAKRSGRDRLVLAPEVVWDEPRGIAERAPSAGTSSRRDDERLDLTSLDQALAERLVVPVFQPVLSTVTGRVVAVEALARLRHPATGELLQPAQFLPLAERTGRVARLDWLVAEQAIARCARWRRDGSTSAIAVGVNVSVAHLDDAELTDQLLDACRRHRLPTDSLIVEVTESMQSLHGRGHEAAVHRLADAGVNVTLDDFGTGFAALSYLLRFPVAGIKIDKSFTAALSVPRGQQVVQAVLDVGRGLGLHVVAEGVETEEQLRQLTAMGCPYVQGFLFSRPVGALDLPAVVADLERRRAVPSI